MGILIGVPHLGELRTALVEQLLEFDKRDDVEIHFSRSRPVDSNRCEIVDYFLHETDHDHLLMIDADVVPPAEVLDLPEREKQIITPLIYSLTNGVPYPVGAVRDENGDLHTFPGDTYTDDEPFQVDAVGTGCICIHRSVFDELDEPYFRYVKNDDGTVNTGEDFDFCLRAQDAGIDIWMDPEVSASHLSEVDLKDFMQVMQMAIDTDKDEVFGY